MTREIIYLPLLMEIQTAIAIDLNGLHALGIVMLQVQECKCEVSVAYRHNYFVIEIVKKNGCGWRVIFCAFPIPAFETCVDEKIDAGTSSTTTNPKWNIPIRLRSKHNSAVSGSDENGERSGKDWKKRKWVTVGSMNVRLSNALPWETCRTLTAMELCKRGLLVGYHGRLRRTCWRKMQSAGVFNRHATSMRRLHMAHEILTKGKWLEFPR
jgi:hypothetical protein